MDNSAMLVTIDGPAGAGKSTISRQLSHRLGFEFLDTGAMYRAAALAVLQADVDWSDPQRVQEIVQNAEIELDGARVILNGHDVTADIRTPEVDQAVGHVADDPQIRALMVAQQRRWAQGRDLVTEGRDQGTDAFPNAECKIYLSASAEERARRRLKQMQSEYRIVDAEYDEILQQICARDQRDRQRPVGALRKAPDAVEVITDGMTIDQVLDRLEETVRRCMQR